MKSNQVDDLDLGYVYLGEDATSFNTTLDNLKRDMNVFYITFDTNLQDFDVQNRNRRYYDAQNIMDCIKSEKIQSLLRTGGWFGEFDHPSPENQNEKLTPERIQNVPPKYRAFKIMNPHLEGNILKAKIQSAQGEIGESFAKEVLAGWIPQFSARSIASIVMKNGKPYAHVRKLITYDSVLFPSHEIAIATSKPQITVKSFTESVNDEAVIKEKVKDTITNIMLPLNQILEDIGKRDVTTQMIMESFELDMDNLYGFDPTYEHVILKDENNMIYSKISPESAKRVQDFLTSF
jgi:hypothetical protein